jgi:hypothetical protein
VCSEIHVAVELTMEQEEMERLHTRLAIVYAQRGAHSKAGDSVSDRLQFMEGDMSISAEARHVCFIADNTTTVHMSSDATSQLGNYSPR